jgi:hypothetical protein
MNKLRRVAWAMSLFLAGFSLGQWDVAAQEAASGKQGNATGIAVLARGPVHEAFAQPALAKPEPGPVVPRKPPAPVREVPPDRKPAKVAVQWIPGYWAWDLEKKDFLWVSGTWRVPPPGRKWTPGYWREADGGWQWVSGFWAPAGRAVVPYVREPPPDSLDNGPSSPAPDQGSVFVPGSWIYRDGDFVWQPGYWQAVQPGWVWIPPHYAWTPAGYVFVDGYWDYRLEDRGLLFAPVTFDQDLWDTPGWSYTPECVVDDDGLLESLFFGPGSGGYYFGNYYGPLYRALGFRPWCLYGPRSSDPLFNYAYFSHGFNPRWLDGLHHDFRARFRGTAPALPVTLAAQNRLRSSGNQQAAGNGGGLRLVTPLNQLGNSTALTAVSVLQLAQQQAAASQVQQASLVRAHLEAARAAHGGPVGGQVSPGGEPALNHRSFYPGRVEPAHSRPEAAPRGAAAGPGGPSTSTLQDLLTAPPRFSVAPQVIIGPGYGTTGPGYGIPSGTISPGYGIPSGTLGPGYGSPTGTFGPGYGMPAGGSWPGGGRNGFTGGGSGGGRAPGGGSRR